MVIARRSEKPKAGKGRDDDIEGDVRTTPLGSWIGQQRDDLMVTVERVRPSMYEEEGHSVRPSAALMNEMEPHIVDHGHVVIETVQFSLMPSPVITGHPVVHELLHVRLVRTSAPIIGIHIAPPGSPEPLLQIVQDCLGDIDLESLYAHA
ncbi:MAG TPA: hypothetical protein PKX44_01315 [Methanomassiliicoccaceae archaeon]|nr:hypothetical protein [Methanomassiliicoccaceae archaeon]